VEGINGDGHNGFRAAKRIIGRIAGRRVSQTGVGFLPAGTAVGALEDAIASVPKGYGIKGRRVERINGDSTDYGVSQVEDVLPCVAAVGNLVNHAMIIASSI